MAAFEGKKTVFNNFIDLMRFFLEMGVLPEIARAVEEMGWK
jgi:hypothetical protein